MSPGGLPIMQRFFTHNLLRLLAVLALVVLAPTPHAAELGDVAARSYIGQPLSADVELLAGDGGPVQARLAQLDVYRGANITIVSEAAIQVKFMGGGRIGSIEVKLCTLQTQPSQHRRLRPDIRAKARIETLRILKFIPGPGPGTAQALPASL